MIGLNRGDDDDGVRAGEPPETRELRKPKLYKMLEEQWLLPPRDSKGVCRTYLVSVHRGQVFRVGLREYKHFEANLNPDHTKKNGYTNLVHVISRLNELLASRNQNQLGFPLFTIPDEKWLIKIARFIDQANVLEFFRAPVRDFQQLCVNTHWPEKIYFCRGQAHRLLIQDPGYMRITPIFDAICKVSEYNRKRNTKILELQETQAKLIDIQQELNNLTQLGRDAIMKGAISIYSVENNEFHAENLIHNRAAVNDDQLLRLDTIAGQ